MPRDAECPHCGNAWQRSSLDECCPRCGRAVTVGDPVMLHCNQCDHDWAPRGDSSPKRCPVCLSTSWNQPKKHQFTCRRCGHVWRNRVGDPDRCPHCGSDKWNDSPLRLQCRRCGYRWTPRTGRSSAEIKMCPSCKSKKWNETPEMRLCPQCGGLFISSGNGARCPACSRKRAFEFTCGFCGVSWSSTSEEMTACPRCGKPNPKRDGDRTIDIWSDGSWTLKYVSSEGFGIVYLWEDGVPTASMYFHDLLRRVRMTAQSFVASMSEHSLDEDMADVAREMHEHMDDYLTNVSYFMKRLGLCEFDATVLAIHFTGMAPEAISVRFGIPIDEVRQSFDRIMDAYSDNEIVVNDYIFTDDPISLYDGVR